MVSPKPRAIRNGDEDADDDDDDDGLEEETDEKEDELENEDLALTDVSWGMFRHAVAW